MHEENFKTFLEKLSCCCCFTLIIVLTILKSFVLHLFVCCCSFSRIFSAFHQSPQSPPCVDNVCWGGFRWHNRVGDYFLATFSWLKTGSVEDKCVWDDLYNVNMLINIMLIVTPPSLHQSAANAQQPPTNKHQIHFKLIQKIDQVFLQSMFLDFEKYFAFKASSDFL